MPTSFYIVFAGIFGLIMGSFLNVVAVRDRNRKSILTGRSICPHCKHVLQWYELIPLFSFLIQGAKCRSCKKPISFRYPLIELLAGVLTIGTVWYGYLDKGSWILAAGLTLSAYIFFVVALIDLETMEIPLEYAVAGGVVAGVANMVTHTLTITDTLLGVVVGGGAIAVVLYGWKLLFKQEGMGVGDIWLAAALGAAVGYPLILISIGLASIFGAVIGSLFLLWKKSDLNAAIPFGPFLFAGALAAVIWGQIILQWYILTP